VQKFTGIGGALDQIGQAGKGDMYPVVRRQRPALFNQQRKDQRNKTHLPPHFKKVTCDPIVFKHRRPPETNKDCVA
jgi:hypothetical protein